MNFIIAGLFMTLGWALPGFGNDTSLKPETRIRVATFSVDATPPLGSPVAYAPARSIENRLSARGVVLLGSDAPVVLCAVDWIGISNSGHDVWREKLATAAGTSPDRVAVHALHQHDAPRCDFEVEELLSAQGLRGQVFDSGFARQVIENVCAAIRTAVPQAKPVTHLGIGEGRVVKVASNRRIIGPDGKLKLFRMSSYRIEPEIVARLKVRADEEGYVLSPLDPQAAMSEPEGVIDPNLKMISFWADEQPLVCLTYYATHPQSYFGKGDVTSEFVGIARDQHQEQQQGLLQVHFNGAGGNIAAGKYNDGTPETRIELTKRMRAGFEAAWKATRKIPIQAKDLEWRVAPVSLPAGAHLNKESLQKTLADEKQTPLARASAARKLAVFNRISNGHQTELSALRLGSVYLVHMPGELFIEYQLAAQAMRPDDVVCMAAYGDYAVGYIGTKKAYAEGGYETGPGSSQVAPEVEDVLLAGLRKLLNPSN